MLRSIRLGATALAIAAVLGFALLWVGREAPGTRAGRLVALLTGTADTRSADGSPLARLSLGGPFTLVDAGGRTVTQASYPGRWLLVYFGYTTCPDICPTTLQSIASALKLLGGAADHVAPLFVTVDPARDTPAVMGRYTALFSSRIVGLSGTPAQVAAAERAFRVYAARVDQPGSSSYLMDHTSFIYLISPAGQLKAMYDRDVAAAAMAASIKRALG